MHHMVVYRCNVPQNMSASSVFKPFLNHPGEECYYPGAGEVKGELPTQYCTDMIFGIAIGGESSFLPEHIGITNMSNYPKYGIFYSLG